jgi:hypothetical protein
MVSGSVANFHSPSLRHSFSRARDDQFGRFVGIISMTRAVPLEISVVHGSQAVRLVESVFQKFAWLHQHLPLAVTIKPRSRRGDASGVSHQTKHKCARSSTACEQLVNIRQQLHIDPVPPGRMIIA